MGLAAYKQIRFPTSAGTYGNCTLVINRPTYESLTQPAADTLYLGEGGEYYPFIVDGSDFQLSKKFTTTRGRRALDDLNVAIRDGLAYTGIVNGVDVSEDFTSALKTFFDVWFNDTVPYKAFLLYHDNITGNDEVTHIGWIDPLYAPSSDAYLFHALTGEQIWLGTRSLKMTAFAQAQLNLTWLDVLANISDSDCIAGTAYNGFAMAPTAFAGQKNTRADLFSSDKGTLMQAVPYQQLTGTANPAMKTVAAAAWPLDPWTSVFYTQTVAKYEISVGGIGYAVGDEGTIDGGGALASYRVLQVSGSNVFKIELTSAGSSYTTGAKTTTATTGIGTGLVINVLKVATGTVWGPSGLVFISIGTLFNKIALAMGVTAPTVVSAYRFWRQVYVGDCFPIKTDSPIDPADLYISLNVFAKSHPADGSYWDNPVGFSYGTPITEVISSLCNLLVADFNVTNASDGTQTLTLTPMGEPAGELPDDWALIGTPEQEEPATGARVVQAKYRADELVIQAPLGIVGDASSIEIPARVRRWGKTSGNDTLPDAECITFDSAKDVTQQADECLKVVWGEPGAGPYDPIVKHIMPDCWKGLCYLYWYHSADSNPGVYPSTWNAFDNLLNNSTGWANSFFVVNAVTRAKQADGTDFTPAADLQAEVNGNDYFNLRPYTAVAFASLTLPKPIIQVLTFAGVSDSTGSIQAIKAGLTKQWRFGGNANQNWVGIQIDQLIKLGQSTVKFQQYGNINGFPGLTDLPYGAVGGTGGTSSTTGSATGGSDSGGSNPLALPFIREFPSEEAQQTITPRADIVTLIHTPYELGQTKDYVQYKNAAGTVIASVSAYGGFLSAPTANVIGFQVNQKEAEGIVAKARAGADGTWASIVVENNSGAYLSGIRENGKIFEGASSNTYLGITHDFSITWRNVGVTNGATTNDLTLGDYTNIRLVNSSGSGDTIITGMTSGSAGGKFLYIINETGYQITLPNDNAGSTAANRFYNGSAADSVVLQQKDTAFYIYDNTLNRWVLFSTTGTGGSGGGGLLYWTEAENTAAPNATVYATSFIPSGAATNIDAVFLPKGSGSILAAIPDNTAAGGDKRGEYSVDLQLGRTAAGEVVTGDYSFAVGFGNEVSDNYAAALGNTNIVSADSAVALGYLNTSSGIQSLTAGYNNIASESFTVAHGHSAVADKFGQASQASGIFTVQGDAQRGSYVLRGVTSDATSTEIFLNGTSLRITLVDYQTITFSVLITCRKAIGSGENAGYKIEGVINRDSGVGSVAFIGTPVVTILGETTGTMDATVTADTTNGALAVFVTGKASTGLQWVATVLTAEVIGAAAP